MKVKSLQNPQSARAHINFLRHAGIPYSLKISNYTMEIISDLYNIQFLHSMRSNRCFAAHAKVKSCVKNLEVPVINKGELEYFMHNFNGDYFSPHVVCIDIKSAYATVLYNDGFINKETYQYLNKIDKMDRLAAVGMLASQKNCFDYDGNGDLIDFHQDISPLAGFFFHCVKRVGDIMNDLKKMSGNDYLFTWVDGIYLKPNDEYLYTIAPYLEANNFNFRVEICYQFTVRVANGKVRLTFWKEDKTKEGFDICKRKAFVIPPQPSMFANDVINYLTNQHTNYEKKTIRVTRPGNARA
jgi:hypothetical protein